MTFSELAKSPVLHISKSALSLRNLAENEISKKWPFSMYLAIDSVKLGAMRHA